ERRQVTTPEDAFALVAYRETPQLASPSYQFRHCLTPHLRKFQVDYADGPWRGLVDGNNNWRNFVKRLRTWLVRQARDLLGISRLYQELRETNETLRHIALTLSAAQTSDAAAVASLQSLERGALFVVGCARSGTTILTRCLNCAPEIMLLEEPLFFLHEGVADFARAFNKQHAAMGNRRQKGSFVAPARRSEFGPLGLLCRLHRDHRYVGEKVAWGPLGFPDDWPRRYLDFQSRHFLHSQYVLILRTPVEAIWSMHKMFPEQPLPRLFETWLRSTSLLLDAYQLFPNCRVVFFNDLSQTLIKRLAHWLEVPAPRTRGMIATNAVRSRVTSGAPPEPLLAFESLCVRCTEIFADLRASFSPATMVYDTSVNRWDYFFGIHQRIEALLRELTPPPSGETALVQRFLLPARKATADRASLHWKTLKLRSGPS
ncbi:MAG TPA: sulfotransferase, partial [Pirellulales bacterium]